ncbi:MAG TPA: hypothetical protein VE152_09340 [Acidimicrobiales bacterium]|nr:hypothetical protein [Acidimicrobiales bacterium]
MSSLWTPGGEHRVSRSGQEAPRTPPQTTAEEAPSGQSPPGADQPEGEAPDAETAEELARLQRELLSAPAEVVVANHAYGLFQLAALHLSQQPPGLVQAKLAIDGFGALLEGLQGRLGDHENELREALAQLRLTYVQLSGAAEATGDTPSATG